MTARRILGLAIGGFLLVRGLETSTPLVVLLGCAIVAGYSVATLRALQMLRREHRAQVETGALSDQPLTYPIAAMGDTFRGSDAPKGYRATERRATIGAAREQFERAAAATLRWEIKTRAGFRVVRVGKQGAFLSDAPVAKGECAIVKFGPIRETVRVIRVVAEPRRRGFAYGTLPEHPLRGEEAFLVEWRDDDVVELTVRSFSRPSTIYGWIAYPVLLLAQTFFVRRYLRVLLE